MDLKNMVRIFEILKIYNIVMVTFISSYVKHSVENGDDELNCGDWRPGDESEQEVEWWHNQVDGVH